MQEIISKDKNEILQSRIMEVTNKFKELLIKHENIEAEHSNNIEQLQHELTNKYESQINDLSTQLLILQSNYDTLQIQHNNLQQLSTDLQTKNASLHDKIHKQEQELALTKEQLNETRFELQSQISELSHANNSQSMKIDELTQELNIALTQRRRCSSRAALRKDLNRTLRVQFVEQNKNSSISEHHAHTMTSPPRLSLSTNEMSHDIFVCDKGGASQVAIIPSPYPPSMMSNNSHSKGDYNFNITPTPNLTKRRIASKSVCGNNNGNVNGNGITPTDKLMRKHSLNYGGSGQLSANSYFEPLMKSETELTFLSIDIEEEQCCDIHDIDGQEVVQVIAN